MRDVLSKVMSQQVSRREFLLSLGALGFGIIGLSSLMKELRRLSPSDQAVAKPYGGERVRTPRRLG